MINGDDEALVNHEFKHKIITYGVDNKHVDYHAANIKQINAFLSFDVEYKNKTVPVTVNIIGEHNVYCALMTFAMAKECGLTDKEIQEGFLSYNSTGIRQVVRKIAGRYFYIDCFNAASDSIKSCLKNTSSFILDDNAKRVAILGGENALGDQSYDVNYRTGQELMPYSNIDKYFFVGISDDATADENNFYGNGKALYDGAAENLDKRLLEYTSRIEDIGNYLKLHTRPGDLILLKGIFRLGLFAVIDIAFGTFYVSEISFFESKSLRNYSNGFVSRYYSIVDSSVITLYDRKDKAVRIPENLNGHKITHIGPNVFKNKEFVEDVYFGSTLNSIGKSAFENTSIAELKLPENVLMIEEGAFKNCSQLVSCRLCGVKHIGQSAFENCEKLRIVNLSRECTTIEENAFKGCGNLVLICPEDSYASLYAARHGIEYATY